MSGDAILRLSSGRPPDVAQIRRVLLITAPVGPLLNLQLPDPVTVQDQQAEQRAVISEREPDLLVVKDSAHPVPDLIVRTHQRRNLRNSTTAGAQVHPGRDTRVGSRAPPQPWPGIHPPIVDHNGVILQGTSPKSHSSAAVRTLTG
jgi:hypothetical protein